MTDLATERTPEPLGAGITSDCYTDNMGIKVTEVNVNSAVGARAVGRPKGRYVTFEIASLSEASESVRLSLSYNICKVIGQMLGNGKNVLVVGLGNRNMTADALGASVADKIMVNRHDPGQTSAVLSAISPGVLGVTGIETYDIIKGVIEKTHPDAVIVVDSLASRKADRISSAFQVTDTGIVPGAGVGNHRFGLSKKTLGIPVIAVGVPFVVFASSISIDAVRQLIEKYPDFRPSDELMNRIVSDLTTEYLRGLVVTPKDIDLLVKDCAQIISLAINSAVLKIGIKDLLVNMRC
ncbi:MAG: GPR endopeptidase [Clostridiales bacterium]|nr:GPR endopeptidase [Clostridiales bacterium]